MVHRIAVALAAVIAGAASPAPAPLVFSDPIAVARTAVAAPPAIVRVDEVLHLFWLDRPLRSPGATGELWYAAVLEDGRIVRAPHRIEAGADTRFGWPAAVRSGSRVYVAWMARTTGGVSTRVTVIGPEGGVERRISPALGEAEEGGRISLLASGNEGQGRMHLVWSQFERGARRVWYARLSADGSVDLPGRPLVTGEAPAVASADPLRLFWWAPAPAGTFTLNTAALSDDGRVVEVPEELSGRMLLVSPLPPIPLDAPGGLDVLVPTTERAFRASGQLYFIRLRGATVTARVPLSKGRPLADVAVATGEAGAIIAWSEPAGRRQSGEIFAAGFDSPTGQMTDVARVSYTVPGSLRPAVALGPVPAAVWLETLDVTRFQVVFGTTLGARRRTFLLGAPELDLARPLAAILFAATVILSVLPYALLFSALFGLAALALLFAAGSILGGFTWWDPLRRPGILRWGAFFGLVLLLEWLGRGVLPGEPAVGLLAVSFLICAAAGMVLLTARARRGGMMVLVVAPLVVVVHAVTVLFPWGVRQLSQL